MSGRAVMGAVLLAVFGAAGIVVADAEWPSMRGPLGDGHAAADAKPPTRWSEQENVRWKTAIPGQGWSTPAVAGDRIWLTTATDAGRSRRAICVDRNSGKLLHNVELFRVAEPAGKHDFNSYASPSAAADDERVYLTFGADGTACLDVRTGAEIWRRTDLIVDHFRGAGSSPILYQDLLLLHFDGTDRQFIVALDRETGKTRWQTKRSHVIHKDGDFQKAYSTPLVRELNGRRELLSIAAECVYGYVPETGKELWRFRFGGFSNAVLPVVCGDRILVNTGFGKARMIGVRAGGSGDVTDTHQEWLVLKNVARMSSPIVVDDDVYMVSDNGVASKINPVDGNDLWRHRLGTGLDFTASPIYANGFLYFCDHKKGSSFVIQPGDTPKVIAENSLAAGCMASPVAVGKALYLRTKTHLYRVEESE